MNEKLCVEKADMASDVEMEEVSIDDFLSDDKPAASVVYAAPDKDAVGAMMPTEADLEQEQRTKSLGFVYVGDIVADGQARREAYERTEIIGFGSPTVIYGLNSNFVADALDVGKPDFSELDALAPAESDDDLIPLEELNGDELDMPAPGVQEIPLIPLEAVSIIEESDLETSKDKKEPEIDVLVSDEGDLVSSEDITGTAANSVAPDEDAVPVVPSGAVCDGQDAGDADDIPLLEGVDTRPAFSFACFGRNNASATELPSADEEAATDVIVADTDGTFRIAEHVPRTAVLDAQLQELIDSVLL